MAFALALGDGAADALRASGHSAVRAFRDELSVGPLSDTRDLDAFAKRRAEHWREVLAGAPWRGGRDPAPPADPLAALRADLRLLEDAAASGEPVEIWAGESLQDLMFLACFAAIAGPAAQIALRRPGGGAAPLSSGLAAQPPQRLRRPAPAVRLPASAVEDLRRFWHALVAPDIAPLRAFASAPPASPSGLAGAARARLKRLPDPATGLDAVEARVIAPLSAAPRPVAPALGAALADGAEGPDLVGDLSLFAALRALADPVLPRPLVALTGDGTIRGSAARLTAFGQEVRAGRADRVAANGWRARLGGLVVDAGPGRDVPRAPAG